MLQVRGTWAAARSRDLRPRCATYRAGIGATNISTADQRAPLFRRVGTDSTFSMISSDSTIFVPAMVLFPADRGGHHATLVRDDVQRRREREKNAGTHVDFDDGCSLCESRTLWLDSCRTSTEAHGK
jgi:hypothetical protein